MPGVRLSNRFISGNRIFKSRLNYPGHQFDVNPALRIHLIRGVMPSNSDNIGISASRSWQQRAGRAYRRRAAGAAGRLARHCHRVGAAGPAGLRSGSQGCRQRRGHEAVRDGVTRTPPPAGIPRRGTISGKHAGSDQGPASTFRCRPHVRTRFRIQADPA